ncbi:MAG TPA: ribosome small subunit-dependent GTPase A [Acidimicrobiales bacterium]|nr:ribosome small subunit-dependent GTPase A [Acidimicrobiales bacterium]
MFSDPSFDALVPLGWDERVATLYASVATEEHQPGRVGRVDRDRCTVMTAAGKVRAAADVLPTTGDWVALRVEPRPAVDVVLPRWSSLEREGQLLAADIDVVFVVAGLDRPLNLNRIERELVLAWDSGARPVVVLTKADAVADADVLAKTVAARAVGTDVVLTSAADGRGVDEVLAHLRPNRTAVLLGPSGAGKSTLVNRLLSEEAQATADVRSGDHKGRHTTTSRHLLVIPAGGVLIDTPGLRSVGVSGAEGGVALAFPDVDEVAQDCKFRDCRHAGEPGCAVEEAVAGGRLDGDRVASYVKLQAELEESAKEPWAKAADRQEGRVIHRAMKKTPKNKR